MSGVTLGLIFHSTPSHGYLQVPVQVVQRVGFEPTRFSTKVFSAWFLEEDCDAPAFLKLASANEIRCAIKEVEEDEQFQEWLDNHS